MAERKFEASKTVETEDGEKEKVTAAVFRDFGENLKEMVEIFGEDLTYKLAYSEADSKIKSAIRRLIGEGVSPEEIPEKLKDWKPGVKIKVAKNPEEEAAELFLAMSDEQRERQIAKLKEKLKGK